MNKRYDFRFDGPGTGVVDTPDALRSLAPEWDALCARDREAGLFLSPRWLIPAMLTEPGKWLVLTARDAAGRLIGLLPLWRRRFRNRKTGTLRIEMEAAGRIVQSAESGFACDPAAGGDALTALAQALCELEWTEFGLSDVMQTARLETFASALDPLRFRITWPGTVAGEGAPDRHRRPRIALPDSFETYLVEKVEFAHRQRLRQAISRHLDSGALRIEDAAKSDRFDRILDHALSSRHHAGAGGARGGDRLRKRLLLAQAQGLLTAPAFYDGPRLLGMLFNVVDARTGCEVSEWTARKPARDEIPVGLLLHAHAIRTAIRRGRLRYDFGPGDAAFKYSLGAEDVMLNSVYIVRTTPA